MNEIPLDQLSAGRLAELAHTKFRVLVKPGRTVSLELMAVTTPGPSGRESVPQGSPDSEGFSLLFDGPADGPLGQGTYRFEHDQLGWFDLFIVPVGGDHNARQYEAVFNRRRAPGTLSQDGGG